MPSSFHQREQNPAVTFMQTLLSSLEGMFPDVLILSVAPLTPFIVAEQIWPVGKAPRIRDYGMNIVISLSTVYMSLPLGIAAALWSGQLRSFLPWKPLSFSFHSISAVPVAGPGLEVLAMIFVPLMLHDLWFYWSHRIEHRVPALWAFHRIHHSDERMNTSTWARDHFLQNSWRTFFSMFTLGLLVDLDLSEAGKAALYSQVFLIALSMFYHSAIRIRLPWLDRVLVTPQVHRIHHAVDSKYHNRNFADALPIFDILFGTFHRPGREEFPATGLGSELPAPRSLWSAQFGPLVAVWRMLFPTRRNRHVKVRE
jgi:sterol desaturase/sphingolipid hydroxylase (fatty acid hydroxylase superfamily)